MNQISFFTRLLFSSIALFAHSFLFAHGRKDLAIQSPLFQDTSILEITLKMNIDEVVRDIEDRDHRYALLSYKSKNGEEIPIELKVKTRGNRRSDPEVCSFPPIRLNFKKKGNLDNIFAGQDRLKLVTHCNSSKIFNQYVLQEYLTYKHYSVLTDYSFLVRLLKVTYVDSATNKIN